MMMADEYYVCIVVRREKDYIGHGQSRHDTESMSLEAASELYCRLKREAGAESAAPAPISTLDLLVYLEDSGDQRREGVFRRELQRRATMAAQSLEQEADGDAAPKTPSRGLTNAE